MYLDYKDLTDRILEAPRWWVDGVPRYCDFSPGQVAIHAKEAALLLIEGQNPEGRFEVGVFSPSYDFRYSFRASLIAYGELYVGDPPNYKDLATPHMSTNTFRVLQYWKRNDQYIWERDSTLELQLLEEDSERPLLPNYVAMARKRAGPRWEVTLAARDVVTLRILLAEVGCPLCDEVARLLIMETLTTQLDRDLQIIWSEIVEN